MGTEVISSPAPGPSGGATPARSRLDELRASLVAADAARHRLARDIHDGSQQRLVSALIDLQLAEQCFDREPDRARRLLDEARAYIQFGLDDLRSLTAGIHPVALATHGLPAAVSTLAHTSALPVELDISPRRCVEPVEVAAYYLIAEALTNVSKHAAASGAQVTTRWVETEFVVEIVDDGVGGADPSQGSGLAGLQARLEMLGATLRIESRPGGGTLICASFPEAGHGATQ